jgi:hypothetical protein
VCGRLLGVDVPEGFAERLTRTAASQAVEAIGWRYLLGTLHASVPVPSLEDGLRVAGAAAAACGAPSERPDEDENCPDQHQHERRQRARRQEPSARDSAPRRPGRQIDRRAVTGGCIDLTVKCP